MSIPSCRFCDLVKSTHRFYVDTPRWAIVEDPRLTGPMLVSKEHQSSFGKKDLLEAYEALKAVCAKVFKDGFYFFFSPNIERVSHIVVYGRRGSQPGEYNSVNVPSEDKK